MKPTLTVRTHVHSFLVPLLAVSTWQGQAAAQLPEDAPILACLHEEAAPAKERTLTIKDRLALLKKRGYVIERRGIATLAVAPTFVRPPASKILSQVAGWISKDGKPVVLDLANSSDGERKMISEALRVSPFARAFDNIPVGKNFKVTMAPAAQVVIRVGNREFSELACNSSVPDAAVNRDWDVNSPLPTSEPTRRTSQQEVLETLGSPLTLQYRGELMKSLSDFALERQKEETEKLSQQMAAEIKKKMSGDGTEEPDEGTLGEFSPTFQKMVEYGFAASAQINGFDSREDALRALNSARIKVSRWTAQMMITGRDEGRFHTYSFTLKTLRY